MPSEKGVHRLVRMSPFDSANRRHTSFAAVEVRPLVSDDVEIDIDEDDLRVDTFRSSGAGGQHVNKTSSAVRITHIPTDIVVQCQNERSQLPNRATAMRMLKSRLLELEERKRAEELARERGQQLDVNFGSQIRSYVLHPYQMVKDLRTDHETGNTQVGARRRARPVRPRLPHVARGQRAPEARVSDSGVPTLRGERVVLRPATDDDAAGAARHTRRARRRRLVAARRVGAGARRRARPSLRSPSTARSSAASSSARRPTPTTAHAAIDIFVADAWQDRGVGSDAMRTLIAYLAGAAGTTVSPSIRRSANERAIHVYERLGFRRVGTMRAYGARPRAAGATPCSWSSSSRSGAEGRAGEQADGGRAAGPPAHQVPVAEKCW